MIPAISSGEKPIDCSGAENQREGIIEIREFDCESLTNCAVGIWAPSTLEEHSFLGFAVVQNLSGPEEYELAFSLEPQSIDNQMVGYLYGTRKTLEKIQVTVSYRREGDSCAVQSTVGLKHNKARQNRPAGWTR